MMRFVHFSAVLVLCTMAACSSKKAPVTPPPTATAPPPDATYKLVTADSSRVSSTVRLPGVLQPYEFVQIYPKIKGFVKTMYVDRGSRVQQGQILMQLEAPEVEEDAAAAKLKYAESQSLYATSKDRYERLLATSKTPGTVSPFDLEAAKSGMEGHAATMQSLLAAYNAEQDIFGYLTVKAPFEGVITERNVHPGALVGAGNQDEKPMLLLQQESRLRLVVSVPEAYSAQLQPGERVAFTINSLPGRQFSATISRASDALNNFRSEMIEIDVNNLDGQLEPGMYGEVTIPVNGSEHGVSVPSSSVMTTTERKYVIAVEDGHAQWIDVHTGNTNGDTTEVFGNLHAGEQVIANATYQIKDGQEIN